MPFIVQYLDYRQTKKDLKRTVQREGMEYIVLGTSEMNP